MRLLRRFKYKLTQGKHYLELTPKKYWALAVLDNFFYIFYGPVLSCLRQVKHVIGWVPTLYRDKDYDHCFLYTMLAKKLNNMADHFESHQAVARWAKTTKECRYAARVAQRIVDDNYAENMPSHVKQGTKQRYQLEDKRRKSDIEYLFRIMRKHSMTWWD